MARKTDKVTNYGVGISNDLLKRMRRIKKRKNIRIVTMILKGTAMYVKTLETEIENSDSGKIQASLKLSDSI